MKFSIKFPMSKSTFENKSETDRFSLPDERGRFGPYGGSFVPETLAHPLSELNEAYLEAQKDKNFHIILKLLN